MTTIPTAVTAQTIDAWRTHFGTLEGCCHSDLVVASELIPTDVQNLLRDRIATVEQLEALILMAADRERVWAAEQLAAELRTTEEAVSEALVHLLNSGLVRAVRPGKPDYVCGPDAGGLLDSLIQSYRDHRTEVLRLMTANALNRIRTSALRAFASAFHFGKKPDG